MLRPDRGAIRLDGKPVHFARNRDAIRAGIGYLSEDRLSLGLIQQQSIADNTVITVLDKLLDPKPLISFKQKDALVSQLDRRSRRSRSASQPTPSRPCRAATSRRVAIAKWLATSRAS